MNSVKNSVKIFSFATLLSIVLSSCSGTPPIVPSDSPQIIPYSESRMAEFSKELSETSEIYIESNNGLRKTVIDLQSGNSYDETTENGTLNKTYFLNQSEGTVPVGVYRLFEKDQLHCYYPIEGDATIDLYKLLIDSNDAKKHNVQVIMMVPIVLKQFTMEKTRKSLSFGVTPPFHSALEEKTIWKILL